MSVLSQPAQHFVQSGDPSRVFGHREIQASRTHVPKTHTKTRFHYEISVTGSFLMWKLLGVIQGRVTMFKVSIFSPPAHLSHCSAQPSSIHPCNARLRVSLQCSAPHPIPPACKGEAVELWEHARSIRHRSDSIVLFQMVAWHPQLLSVHSPRQPAHHLTKRNTPPASPLLPQLLTPSVAIGMYESSAC